jgi:hypothetical protein
MGRRYRRDGGIPTPTASVVAAAASHFPFALPPMRLWLYELRGTLTERSAMTPWAWSHEPADLAYHAARGTSRNLAPHYASQPDLQ